MDQTAPVEALIVAVPETAGSALYGMIDVLSSAGSLWQQLAGAEPQRQSFHVRIASPSKAPFTCGHRIPVQPDVSVEENPSGEIVILPELWLAPDDDMEGRYPSLLEWVRQRYQAGSTIYSACSGSVMLAATGLLDNRDATSHWGYEDLFRTRFPKVRFHPEPALLFADPAGRIVTAGGTTSWHDLALHIIARHMSPGEALRIAKVYLLKWHSEGQLPYAALVRPQPHADSVVRVCEQWLAEHYRDAEVVTKVVTIAGIPERSVKRRFKAATGTTLIGYVQNLRVEDAKRRLESEDVPFETIAADLGYENHAFFRRLFKRSTGLTPGQYRKMFRPFVAAGQLAPASP